MIVKDEEKVIERCLNTVVDIVDEIIIVDTGSQDSTKEKVKKYKADIYDFPWKDDFAEARNFAFSKARMDYILWLDGDDFIDDENISKIENLLKSLDTTVPTPLKCIGRDFPQSSSERLSMFTYVEKSSKYIFSGSGLNIKLAPASSHSIVSLSKSLG